MVLPSLDVSSSLCTTDAPFAVAGDDAGLAMPPTGPTLDAPDPTLLWCESACESATVVHLLAGESLPPIGEDVDACCCCCCWCVSKALSCEPEAKSMGQTLHTPGSPLVLQTNIIKTLIFVSKIIPLKV